MCVEEEIEEILKVVILPFSIVQEKPAFLQYYECSNQEKFDELPIAAMCNLNGVVSTICCNTYTLDSREAYYVLRCLRADSSRDKKMHT